MKCGINCLEDEKLGVLGWVVHNGYEVAVSCDEMIEKEVGLVDGLGLK